jgi:hypothetical protein
MGGGYKGEKIKASNKDNDWREGGEKNKKRVLWYHHALVSLTHNSF